MIFWILTPVSPRMWVPLFWGEGLGGVGGGSKLLCVLWPLCVYLDLGPKKLFSCNGPPNPWRGSRVPTLGTSSRPPPPIWPLASEDLAVLTLDRLFSGT